MPKEYRYKGLLGHPRPVSPLLLAAWHALENAELQERATKEWNAWTSLLVRELVVDCGEPPADDIRQVNWLNVALTLAERHVPAFSLVHPSGNSETKRGAPRKRSWDDEVKLYLAVQKRRADGESESDAVRHAAKELKLKGSYDAWSSSYRRTRDSIDRITKYIAEASGHLRQK